MSTRAAETIRAARAVHLPSLWVSYALPLQGKGAKFSSNFAPCCGEGSRKDATSIFQASSGCWRWHCFRCGTGGTSIDLVAQQESCSEMDAARRITDRDIAPVETARIAASQAEDGDPEAVKEVVKCLREALDGCLDIGVLEELRGRGIHAQTVLDASDQGLLLTLPLLPARAEALLRVNIGLETLKASGLLRGRWTAAAYRPLVFLPAGGRSIEFRSVNSGRPPKALQYGSVAPLMMQPESGNVRQIVVVEGGIDMLSVHQLATRRDSLIVGLLGASKHRPEWWSSLAARHPEARWLLATDADNAGETSAQAIAACLPDTATFKRLAPAAKDWNDVLRQAA